MTAVSIAADFVYGNTRLRARRAELLDAGEVELLLGRDLEGILEVLADSAYRPELEAALATASGARALHAALRRHLVRALAEMRAFYDGDARKLVDLLLSRYDLQNLLTLLRARARGMAPEDALANLVPLGALGGAAADEVARQTELASAVGLLLAWRLPERETARALAVAWPEYERTEDLAALEHALVADHALRLDQALLDAGGDAEPLRELVARERDAANLLVVLRLHSALEHGQLDAPPAVPEAGRYLAGGKISARSLEAALRRLARAEVAAELAAAARRDGWRAPLERAGAGGDLVALQGELEADRVRWATGLFLVGDPLSVDVPIAYTVANENEVRTVRMIAAAAQTGMPASALRPQLILPWQGG